ncbi:unnamed protein product [Chrysodeixis includens]|uniref:WD repeat-containing protein 18 n=1 Tax=Chrysodeixis includens TaxID=689277 RepID=A0A9N8L427_CHRIL|nr:unnamed protein product [Chrysodeixis includens]
MASLIEVLVTSDSNNTVWTNAVWDPNTGTSLMTYKGGGTAEDKTLAFIGKDYIASVEKTRPILHIWPLNSYQTVQGIRFILPGKATSLAVSPNGEFVVAGIEEKIYLWQMASGNLLTIIARHYQKVGILKFTPDGSYFISGSDDGMIMVWSLAAVSAHPEVELVQQTSAGQHDPMHMISAHCLPITDFCVSKTGMHGRLCSTSSDRSCKIFDLASGELLLNVIFTEPLTAITFDILELKVFVGSVDGKIYEFSLMNPPRDKDVMVQDLQLPSFNAHTKAVTCLSVSLDGETLMSGSNDELVILWHIRSKQPLRTIRHKGPITNAFFTINLPAIYKQNITTGLILHPLDRTTEKEAEDVNELEVYIKNKIDFWPDVKHQLVEKTMSSKEAENEFKLKEEQLQAELDKLKAINQNLYAMAVHNALKPVPGAQKKNKKKKKKENTAE